MCWPRLKVKKYNFDITGCCVRIKDWKSRLDLVLVENQCIECDWMSCASGKIEKEVDWILCKRHWILF
jgi:hypothetical protein